jgi:hypothetical protein
MSIGPIVLALVLTGRQQPAHWVDPSPHTSAMIHVNACRSNTSIGVGTATRCSSSRDVEADTREMYLQADGRVKQFPAPLSVIQELIASGTAAPPDYSAVRAPSLAVFAGPTQADVPGDADTSLRQRTQEFLEAVLVPMQREQIDQLRIAVPKVTIVELTGTTHVRFMVERRTEVVRAMTAFLRGVR